MLNPTTMIKVCDPGENSTSLYLGIEGYPLGIPKESVESYRERARMIIDEMSKDLNPTGISALLSALLYEYLADNYVGKNNCDPQRSGQQ
jgi:hypothetical protein